MRSYVLFGFGMLVGALIIFAVTKLLTEVSLSVNCRPNYVYAGQWVSDDTCKTSCYTGTGTSSYKKDFSTMFNQTFEACFCDVNDCNPK